MFEWRILRVSRTGTNPQTITVNDEIARIQEISVEPNGNCLECSFEGLPSALPIEVRDVLTIETRPDSLSSWTPIYKGVVILTGNPRSPRLQPYRMIGLKQRFYEVLNSRTFQVHSDDVSVMAQQVLNGIDATNQLPAGVDLTTIDAPNLNFTAGDRYPQFESIGATLDYLAGIVGQFIVPTGDTYSYDGDTYTADQLVPAVKWGVRADGSVFFRRPNKVAPTEITEGAAGIQVEWPTISAEEIVTNPRLVYAGGFSPDIRALTFESTVVTQAPVAPVGVPIGFQDDTRDNRGAVAKLVQIDNGLDFCTVMTATMTVNSWSNAANSQDGDPTTYAEYTSSSINNFLRANGFGVAYSRLYGNLGWLLTLDIEYDETQPWEIEIRVEGSGNSILNRGQYYFVSPDTRAATRLRTVLPIAVPAAQAQYARDNSSPVRYVDARIRATGAAATGIKVYDFRFWDLDSPTSGGLAVAERIAEAYRIPEVDNVATVTQPGLQPLTQSLVITPVVGSGTVTMDVIRMQYGITVDRGITTTFLGGEAFDGTLNVQRAVLARLAERSASALVTLSRSVIQ